MSGTLEKKATHRTLLNRLLDEAHILGRDILYIDTQLRANRTQVELTRRNQSNNHTGKTREVKQDPKYQWMRLSKQKQETQTKPNRIITEVMNHNTTSKGQNIMNIEGVKNCKTKAQMRGEGQVNWWVNMKGNGQKQKQNERRSLICTKHGWDRKYS